MKALQAVFAILVGVGGFDTAMATGHGAAAAQAVVTQDAHTQIVTQVPQPAPAPGHDEVITHYLGPPIAPPPIQLLPPPGADPGPDMPLSVQVDVTWPDRPDFLHDVYFASDAWGPMVPVPPSSRPGQWAKEIWKKGELWLVVETVQAPPQSQLCADWRAPDGSVAREECQSLPEGVADLFFASPDSRNWPRGTYRVELSQRSVDDPTVAVRALASVAFGAGGSAQAAMMGHPETPSFPWPPPLPTSKAAIDRGLLAQDPASLGDVAGRLTAALKLAGYDAGNRSFYSVPGGFALATHMEQIEEDGTPKPGSLRWSTNLPPRALFSLGDFIHALFNANEGHYRVIVFVVTDAAVANSGDPATEAQAHAWLNNGLAQLPASIAQLPFGQGYECTALIYEFRKVASESAPIANPDGAPSAVEQMQRSGITEALQQ
jgi:hypothetical protein